MEICLVVDGVALAVDVDGVQLFQLLVDLQINKKRTRKRRDEHEERRGDKLH